MQKSWMPVTAGVISIVAGSLGVLVCLVVGIIMMFGVGSFMGSSWGARMPSMVPAWILLFICIPFLLIAILAIIGGIFSIKARYWGWALAGSIAALFPWWILGVPAIVFVIVGRDEFK
jgi:hypothetical protein